MLVLWDRDCGFCAWMLAQVLRRDRRALLRTAHIQGPLGERHLGHMEPSRRLASWHLVHDDGRVESAGVALTSVLREVNGGRPLAALTGRLPRVTERGYGWVATHRSLLSKPIPAEAKQRARELVASRAAEPVT